MLLERHLTAVVADGVEVQVEARLAGVEAELLTAARQRLQKGEVRGAPDPVGVAREVRRLRQGAEPEKQPEAGIAAEGEGVRRSAPARALQNQQRADRVQRGEDARGGVVSVANKLVEPKRHELGEEQVDAGVVAVKASAGGPGSKPASSHRLEARRRSRGNDEQGARSPRHGESPTPSGPRPVSPRG